MGEELVRQTGVRLGRPEEPREKTVSVIVGDDDAHSYDVPQANIAVDRKSGKLTNNTTKTINYTLS